MISSFEISINSDSKAQSHSKGIYTTLLNAQFKVKNLQNDAIIEVQNITTKGIQLSYKTAGEKAYEEAARQIETRLLPYFFNAFLKTE